MKRLLQSTALCFCLCVTAQAGEITLTVSSGLGVPAKLTDEVVVNANETAQVTSHYGSGIAWLRVIKNDITNSMGMADIMNANTGSSLSIAAVTVAGPATIRLELQQSISAAKVWFCRVKIEPESFPPGQTIILPQGTVGVIHVESSTNLVQWQDEWVHTFSNTNQNQFFRLRAERSLP
jgi:hypothetical protein